jgi:hypothetical protein
MVNNTQTANAINHNAGGFVKNKLLKYIIARQRSDDLSYFLNTKFY